MSGRARPGPTEHDRRRLRTTWRVVAAGPVLGVVAAVVVAAIGLSGRAGLAVVLLASALTCVVAALLAVVQATVDEYAGRPVALRRLFTALGLFLAAGVLVVLLGGLSAGT